MKLPLVVVEGSGVMIFSSVEHALGNLEIQDIENGECSVYDAEGYLLKFEITRIQHDKKFLGFIGTVEENVEIVDRDPVAQEASTLHKILENYLVGQGIPKEEVADASLDTLISRASEYPLYT